MSRRPRSGSHHPSDDGHRHRPIPGDSASTRAASNGQNRGVAKTDRITDQRQEQAWLAPLIQAVRLVRDEQPGGRCQRTRLCVRNVRRGAPSRRSGIHDLASGRNQAPEDCAQAWALKTGRPRVTATVTATPANSGERRRTIAHTSYTRQTSANDGELWRTDASGLENHLSQVGRRTLLSLPLYRSSLRSATGGNSCEGRSRPSRAEPKRTGSKHLAMG